MWPQRSLLAAVSCILLLLWPQAALANTGIPLLSLHFIWMVAMFVPVVLAEGLVYRRAGVEAPWSGALWANVISTLVGLGLAFPTAEIAWQDAVFVVYWADQSGMTREELSQDAARRLSVLAGLFLFHLVLSTVVEWVWLRLGRGGGAPAFPVVARAHLASYAVLAVWVCYSNGIPLFWLTETGIRLEHGRDPAPEVLAGPEMVRIAPGTFHLGPEDNGRVGTTATLDQAFWLGRTEVTQALWKAVMGRDPTFPSYSGNNLLGGPLPVSSVSWWEAVSFCNALTEWENARTGARMRPAYLLGEGRVVWDPTADGYRLPTEVEWEYAARAGGLTRRHAGIDTDAEICRHGNIYGGKRRGGSGEPSFDCDDGFEGPSPVGSFLPNGWGLFDMTGNVAEWTWDDGSHGDGPTTNPPREVLDGEWAAAVVRGSSWKIALPLDVTERATLRLQMRKTEVGVRLARTDASAAAP